MKKDEALQQIESITNVINNNSKILLSAPHLIILGILLCLVPVINYVTDGLTFGANIPVVIIIWINVIFYILLFKLTIKAISKRYKKEDKEERNPLIQKALKVKHAFTVIFVLGSISLSIAGYGVLVYPIIYILIGLLYNLIGQFSYKVVRFFSWIFILGGILFVYLTSAMCFDYLWMIFIWVMGISYIIMGVVIANTQKSE